MLNAVKRMRCKLAPIAPSSHQGFRLLASALKAAQNLAANAMPPLKPPTASLGCRFVLVKFAFAAGPPPAQLISSGRNEHRPALTALLSAVPLLRNGSRFGLVVPRKPSP